MNSSIHHVLAVTVLAAAAQAGPTWAHEGEDHSAPAAMATQSALPRASATTDDFEVVAVLEDKRLLIHVDRGASNEPVLHARVEVEGAGPVAVAPEVEPGGVYALALAQPLQPGTHTLTFTVHAADAADLITATLLVPQATATPAGVAAPAAGGAARAWAARSWPWVAAGLGLAGLAVIVLRRRPAAARTSSNGSPE